MSKIHTTRVITQVNEDGQVLEEKKTQVYNWGHEPDYIKIYLTDILRIHDLQKGLNPILLAFLKRMAWANGEQMLYVNMQMKKEICDELGIKDKRIKQAITQFVKSQIFIRKGSSTYQVNPMYFGRGEWNDIAKIRMTVTYDADGKKMESIVVRDKKAIKRDKKTLLNLIK